MTSLRITTSHGEVVREPDRVAMTAAVEAAGRSGPGAFVVLDGDAAGATPFLQAFHLGRGTWRVEVWRVEPHGPGERYWAVVPDADGVGEVFWSWATGTDRWQQLRWQPVTAPALATAG